VEELGERLLALRLVVTDRQWHDDAGVELGDELGRLRGAQLTPDGDTGDVHGADVAQLLLGEQVTDVAEVDRVEPVELDRERRLLAPLLATSIVAIRPHASQQDVADLVLAGTLENERGLEAGREHGRPVPGPDPLGAGQGRVVRVADGDDVTGDPAAGGSHDGLVRVRHDDGVPPAQPDARPPEPGDLHPPILARPAARSLVGSQTGPPQTWKDRRRLPNRRPRSEGGRMEPWRVRSEVYARFSMFNDNARSG
jgi:hypothetical protein